jgi:hypothetical protein
MGKFCALVREKSAGMRNGLWRALVLNVHRGDDGGVWGPELPLLGEPERNMAPGRETVRLIVADGSFEKDVSPVGPGEEAGPLWPCLPPALQE